MRAEDVVEFVQWMQQNGIDVVVDGGWGVDALLGHQTRPHDDLDIAIQHKDLPKVREMLLTRGYRHLPTPYETEFNFTLVDAEGRKVDVHTYTFDSEGKLVEGIEYPFESLKGTGSIDGQSVRCITAEWMVKFHTQYEPDEDDFRDVLALCTRFGIALPEIYRRFVGK
jgi:lincosamide nucleotidyltransferase A/C/D/E